MSSTVADYIACRLKQRRVTSLFGVPGVSCAEIFAAADRNGLTTVICSNDLESGYAADGYARMRGLSAVTASRGPGMLSLLNAIAGAYVERSPVVVLNGGPDPMEVWKQQRFGLLASHSLGYHRADFEIFKNVTELAICLNDFDSIADRFDHAIATASCCQRPVYIEIPKTTWLQPHPLPTSPIKHAPSSAVDEEKIVEEVKNLIVSAKNAIIILGEEVQRYRLADEVESLVAALAAPWATTPLGKSVISEDTPNFIGIHYGVRSPQSIKAQIDKADLLLALGCAFNFRHSDIVLSARDRMVHAYNGVVRIGDNFPRRFDFTRFISALNKRFSQKPAAHIQEAPPPQRVRIREPQCRNSNSSGDELLTYENAFKCINDFLDETWIVLSDTNLSTASCLGLNVFGSNSFVSDSLWSSVGHSVAASIGVGLASSRRPLAICGDGSLQMMVQSLSTLARHGVGALVLVLDNGIYALEQFLLDRKYFDDPSTPPIAHLELNRWNYISLAYSMGLKNTLLVRTTGELQHALNTARTWSGPGLIQVEILSRDLPPELADRTDK